MKRSVLGIYVGFVLILTGCSYIEQKNGHEISGTEESDVSVDMASLDRYLGKWASDGEEWQQYLEVVKQGEDKLIVTSFSDGDSEGSSYVMVIDSLERDKMDCLSLNENNRYFFYFLNENQLTYHSGVNVVKHPKTDGLSKPITYVRMGANEE